MCNQEKKELIKNMYPELKGKDFDKLIYFTEQTNLDPLRNQIYAVKRNVKSGNTWIVSYTIQTSIDGFRLIAERTGKYAPGKEPMIILDENKNIVSSTAYVKKMTDDKTWHEVAATAYYEEYVQTDKEGKPTRFWKQMPKLMLSKCAEALALRKAFPDALSGIYTDDEMEQAENKEETKEEMENTITKANEVITDEKVKYLNDLVRKLPEENQIEVLDDLYDDFNISTINQLLNKNFIAFNNELSKRIKQYKGKK